MNTEPIILKKSLGRVIFYGLLGLFWTVIGLFALWALFFSGSDFNKLRVVLALLAAPLGAILPFGIAGDSIGSLWVSGMELIEQTGFKKATQRIDLNQVVRMEVKVAHDAVGLQGTTNTQRVSYRDSETLVLTAADGSTFDLSPKDYRKDQRVKLAPVLTWLHERTEVAKVGNVAQALAIWFTASTEAGMIAEAQLEPSGVSTKAKNKGNWGLAAFMGIVCVVIFSPIALGFYHAAAYCKSIAASHGTTTAVVTAITMHSDDENHEDRVVSDPNQAGSADIKVRYTVDGKNYAKTIRARYGFSGPVTKAYLPRLYNEAETGSLDLVYATGHPDKVRPALEFTPGAPNVLCRS